MKKLGLDYETLRKENPAIIYCFISGFGQEGMEMDLVRALRMEAGMAAHLFDTEDKNEACRAFLEKR